MKSTKIRYLSQSGILIIFIHGLIFGTKMWHMVTAACC